MTHLLEETAQDLPLWVRLALAAFAALFAALAWWLASTLAAGGWVAAAGLGLSALVALVLAISAIRGRISRWMWFLTAVPPVP